MSEAVSVYGRIGGCFGTDTMGEQEVQEARKTKQLVFTIFVGLEDVLAQIQRGNKK